MPFNDVEIAHYADLIEKLIWAKRRPPLHLRDKVREGQRIEGHEIELFLVRPLFSYPALDRAIDRQGPLREEPECMEGVVATGGPEVAPLSSPAGSQIPRGLS